MPISLPLDGGCVRDYQWSLNLNLKNILNALLEPNEKELIRRFNAANSNELIREE